MDHKIQLILESLCSHQKIYRDRGLVEIQSMNNALESTTLRDKLLKLLSEACQSDKARWETLQGYLSGCKVMLLNGVKFEDYSSLLSISETYLDHEEARLRLEAGETIGALCSVYGVRIYDHVKDNLLENIRRNLQHREDPAKMAQKLGKHVDECVTEIFHDTAGWKSLETSLSCLKYVVSGCGETFIYKEDLLHTILSCLEHSNRFVRESGFYLLSELFKNKIVLLRNHIADALASGLSDNWSQVRMAASVATRNFLVSLDDPERTKYMGKLVAPMCLNRYYVAEGVKIYSQETWKMLTEEEGGANVVGSHMDAICRFYIDQSKADNHAVREAACACISELGSKISKDKVRNHTNNLMLALIGCFQDDSWPVRDAACVAAGNFVKNFPDECRSFLQTLYPLFFDNLEDYIPSVRQGAAVALRNVAQVYGVEALNIVLPKLQKGLLLVQNQCARQSARSHSEPNVVFGVVSDLVDQEHTDQPMFSCGSLAPKMGRGGCSDCRFRRKSEPWEKTDGVVYLLTELAEVQPDIVAGLMPELAKCLTYRHFDKHVCLLETVAKCLPRVADGLGKKRFKQHLEIFFDHLFHGADCDNSLTSSACQDCLSSISTIIGPSILRGRLEMHNLDYVDRLKRYQFAAPSSTFR